ncbi:MAG: hypothetical protein JNN30_01100 [Rhodanobacteraceae bacterium]|nr:hypothetical protein [Rhodanobacteraceae bacterium]
MTGAQFAHRLRVALRIGCLLLVAVAMSPQAAAQDATPLASAAAAQTATAPPVATPVATALAAEAGSNAASSNTPPKSIEQLLPQLLGLFVVATVLELALSLLFQWRLYREFFNGRAVKTLVMIAAGYAVVLCFDYDIFARIAEHAGGKGTTGTFSQFLSACVLAGGSAGVYELFKALGLRPPVDPEKDKPKPDETKAWVSVKIMRQQAQGEIKVHLVVIPTPDPDKDPLPTALATTVNTPRSVAQRLFGVFFADPLRFPNYGGWTVHASTLYEIYATDEAAHRHTIYRGKFANRAIVDFVATF